MSKGHKMSQSDARSFVLAGNATFTIRSQKTGTRYTYRVRQNKRGTLYFVSVLTNPGRYTYAGVIDKGRPDTLRMTRGSKIKPTAPSVKAFRWFLAKVMAGDLPDECEVWHEGTCGRCGRELTVPESIQRGIGPVCWQVMSAVQSRLV
jgi:hypothetical protein